MDTREKIITAVAARGRIAEARSVGRSLRFVKGPFEPLLAAHAEGLARLKQDGELLVVGVAGEGEFLKGEARAELVAALACVDVVLCPGEWEQVPEAWSDLTPGHDAARASFLSLVKERLGA
jgi:bifunctional ADP-heptose synthase (sugar kinase/adenylyltransferase)